MTASEMLAVAKRQLDQMCLVGITERLDESVALVCREFGWQRPAEVEWKNVGTQCFRTERLSGSELALLRTLNEADSAGEGAPYEHRYELYEFANRLFAQAIDRAALAPTGRPS